MLVQTVHFPHHKKYIYLLTSPFSSIVSLILSILYWSKISLRISSSSFWVGIKSSKIVFAEVPKEFKSTSMSSSSGFFFSGNSYKKSSISFWVYVFSISLGPFIAAWEPNKLFPIPFFQIVGGALLILILKSSVGGGIKTFDVLNKFPLLNSGGGGGGSWGGLGPPSKNHWLGLIYI